MFCTISSFFSMSKKKLYMQSLSYLVVVFVFLISLFGAVSAFAQNKKNNEPYTMQEIVDSGHRFFGEVSGDFAKAIQNIFSRYGLPNGYIQGEEGSGAFIGGLTYGEGTLFTKNVGDHHIFWQGPSIGLDYGGQGSRVMMLVYQLDNVQNIWGRYGGVSGSAYLVAGVGFNVLKRKQVLLVPIHTGVGARLGVNIGYLKLTPKATWNPF